MEDQKGHIFTGQDLKDKRMKFRIGEKYKIYCPNITLNYEYQPSKSIDGLPLTAGEFGIYCSHYEIMLKTVQEKNKTVLVFEDDASIPMDFNTKLQALTQKMPNYKKYEAIFLCHAISSAKKYDQFMKISNLFMNNELQRITNYNKVNAGCVHAMIYSYKGAAKILDSLKPNAGIDLDFWTEVNKKNGLTVYRAKNIDLQQVGEESLLEDMGRILR